MPADTHSLKHTHIYVWAHACRCPALFLAKDAVLSTFSVAKQTSIVVDSGYSCTTGKACQYLLLLCCGVLCCVCCSELNQTECMSAALLSYCKCSL